MKVHPTNFKNDPNGNIRLDVFSSFRYFKLTNPWKCWSKRGTEIGAEIYCTFIDRFRSVHGKASALNIKFYVAGVVDVPRMWIDRCIK